jgi:hypothetical protein
MSEPEPKSKPSGELGLAAHDLARGPMMGSHGKRLLALVRYFHAIGLSIAVIADRQHLGRRPTTVKRYARKLGLTFPDYRPRSRKP